MLPERTIYRLASWDEITLPTQFTVYHHGQIIQISLELVFQVIICIEMIHLLEWEVFARLWGHFSSSTPLLKTCRFLFHASAHLQRRCASFLYHLLHQFTHEKIDFSGKKNHTCLAHTFLLRFDFMWFVSFTIPRLISNAALAQQVWKKWWNDTMKCPCRVSFQWGNLRLQ